MEQVMLDGPWRIKLVPIMLKVWKTNKPMKKDSALVLPLWIKMHNVPIVAYSHGRSSYADSVVATISLDIEEEQVCIAIDYEWPPSFCCTCKCFNHGDASCPIKPQEAKRSSFEDNDDVVAPACGKVQTKRNKDKGKK
ncbi:chaperone protein DnaJ C76, chloroplastic, partial [Tanacetum coccineum]